MDKIKHLIQRFRMLREVLRMPPLEEPADAFKSSHADTNVPNQRLSIFDHLYDKMGLH